MRHALAIGAIAVCLGCGGASVARNRNQPAPSAGSESARSGGRDPRDEALELVAIFADAGLGRTDGATALSRLRSARYADLEVEGTRRRCLESLDAIALGGSPESATDECSAAVAALADRYRISDDDATGGASAVPFEDVVDGELTDDDPRVPDDDSAYDEFTIDLEAGWTIAVGMQSEDFDTYLWLIGPDGSSVEQNDDTGDPEHPDTNSAFRVRVTTAGRYRVRANSYDGTGRGRYRLQVWAGPTAAF